MPQVEQLTSPLTYHGEGPCWSDFWGGLALVDMLAGDVCFLQPDLSVRRWHLGKVVAVVRPRVGGGLVAATERHLVVADAPFGALTVLDQVFDDPAMRFNEGACDPAGNFVAGSMSYAEAKGAGSLYRLTADHRVEKILGGVTTSNGLCWSPAGDTAYYVDSPTRRIDMFDSDPDGGLRHRRPFVTVPDGDFVPDGLTVDAEGGVWVALFRGSAVLHYDSAGVLQQYFDVPATQVTACTFGGPGLDQLFITTSRENLDPADADPAGSIFLARPGVIGLPTRPFAG